jgi:hypothetical protein
MTNWITTAEWLYEPKDDGYYDESYLSKYDRPYDPFYGVYGDFIPGTDEFDL